MIQDCQGQLFELIAALNSAGRLSNLLDSRKQHSGQDSNDGDNHQKLDQREPCVGAIFLFPGTRRLLHGNSSGEYQLGIWLTESEHKKSR